MASWSFLTNYALVLTYIGQRPDSTGVEIAGAVGITERATRKIIADLQAAQQQLRADQNELAQRAAAVQAPAAFSNALDIGNAAPPAPAAAPPPRAAQPQRQTSSPQTPRAPAVPPPRP